GRAPPTQTTERPPPPDAPSAPDSEPRARPRRDFPTHSGSRRDHVRGRAGRASVSILGYLAGLAAFLDEALPARFYEPCLRSRSMTRPCATGRRALAWI